MARIADMHETIDCREALRRLGVLLPGGMTLAGESAPFTPADIAVLDEVAETILPDTGTPGARAPGRYDPAVPRESGDRSWAKHAAAVGGARVPGISNGRRQCRAPRNSACS